jgi:3-hydroxybutyryl-CoA dehydrogenase
MESETEQDPGTLGVRILLVRHGETDFNLTHHFQGRIDIPLNKEGRNQAQALALALKNKPITAIYSSPLTRAMETARSIKAFHPSAPLFEEEGLIEMDLGELDGKQAGDWISQHQEFYKTWRTTPSRLKMPGGESLEDVRIRAMDTLERITKSYPPGSTLLLCSHNFVNRTIICQALGLPLDRFRDFQQDAAALNVLYKREGRLLAEVVNDVSHLKKCEETSMQTSLRMDLKERSMTQENRIRNVVVIGTGMLGTQIAIQAACYGYNVNAYDEVVESFQKTFQRIPGIMKRQGKGPTVPMEQWEQAAQKVKLSKDLAEALREADLVIEAVPEKLDLKRKTFSEMDLLAAPGAILATNSSSIPISKIETATRRPEKCLNLHFYMPATSMNMVDIMGGTRTTPETIRSAQQWVRSIGCVPLTVKKEILGFCFNSVWRSIKKQSLFMWANEYVDFQDIDRAWMIFTGMKQGPFGLMDTIGLDVVSEIEMVYYSDSKDPRDKPPDALVDKIKKGELGVKSGKGFYTYPDPEFTQPEFLNLKK